jgi:tetratricopeptide (TPR) repeat protein
LADAEFTYKNILKNNVRSKAAHSGLARIFEKQQKIDESVLEYKRVIDIDEGDSTAYKALVRLYEQTDNIGKLEEEWRFKASINTQNGVLQHYLQSIQNRDGRKNPVIE